MRSPRSLVLVLASLTISCGGATPNGSPVSDSATAETPDETDSGTFDTGVRDTAAADTSMPPTAIDLPFVATNVGGAVHGMPFGTQGNLVLDRSDKYCGFSGVTINTETGKIACSGGVVLGVNFKVVEQSPSSGISAPPALGVFVLRNLTIGEGYQVLVEGKNALVIVVQQDLRIAGTLLLQPGVGGYAGGGYRYLDGLGPGGGGSGIEFANAGAGGAGYCLIGGKGGDTPTQTGGAAGASYGSPALSPLLGGSGGGSGNSGGGGIGGGAVQLVAGGTLTIAKTGVVDAGGRGGAHTCSGGAGGGSGGGVLLEATNVTLEGIVAANGGGGGDTSSMTCLGGSALANGTADATPAKVGIGGAGAAGAVGAQPGGSTTTSDKSAGGGGGAAGRIRINAKTSNIASTAIVSPSVSSGCASKGTPTPKS